MPDQNRLKKPILPKTYPETAEWTPPGEEIEKIEVNHPIFRQAPKISIGLGIITAVMIFIFRESAPWWMPAFAGCLVAAIAYRLLRPRLRHPSIEDEI